MALILDTSILIDIEQEVPETLHALAEIVRYEQHPASISFMSYFEFLYGLRNQSYQVKQEKTAWLRKFLCLEAGLHTAEILAELRQRYATKGKPLPLADMIIAAQTKEHHLTLVTKDKLFDKIEEIKAIVIT
ncbi:type II toxin-antitoxin system VapC family toxin [Candidatus Woesearchaeota archaeon]|nr:type II toxin-antitoxin system VapC family toxin [Candidatus Woesearchaeota archaeon]